MGREHVGRPRWDRAGAVVFASWRPWRVLAGGYLFGAVTIGQLHAQASLVAGLPSQLLSALPLYTPLWSS